MTPKGWINATLKQVASKERKITYGIVQPGDYCDDGVVLIRGKDYSFGWVSLDDFFRVSPDVDAPYKRSKVKKDDILLTIVGAGTGNVSIVPGWLENANITQTTARVCVDKAKYDYKFIYYVLSSSIGARQVYKYIKGGAQPGLNLSDVEKFSLEIPPLPEQKKIAQILSTWDKAIEAVDKLIENSQKQKKWLMQNLLTGKKRLPGFSGEWKKVVFGDLGTTYSGLTGKSKDDFGHGKPYVTYMNVFSNHRLSQNQLDYVSIARGESQNKIKYGDILFTTSSETPEEVGMSSVVLCHLDEVYLNSFCFGFRMSTDRVMRPEYASFLLRSDTVRVKISKMAQGATRYNLSKNQLKKLEIHVPPVDEQHAISQILDLSFTQEVKLKDVKCRLQSEKISLMQQLLTGKRRVKVDETHSPASAG